MLDYRSSPSLRRTTVQQDWRAWLSTEKAQVFREYEHNLESLYQMFSVSLNEAIDLKQAGLAAMSQESIDTTSDLCERLIRPLAGMLRALYDHAKHYGTIPNAAPLDPANYRGQREQRSARVSGLLNRVLLSSRLQFLQKVGTLVEMVEDLGKDFRNAADALADGTLRDPERVWNEIDADHYDLNTCLRETIVLFKSFLIALPVGQIEVFQNAISKHSRAQRHDQGARRRVIRNRRLPEFERQ